MKVGAGSRFIFEEDKLHLGPNKQEKANKVNFLKENIL